MLPMLTYFVYLMGGAYILAGINHFWHEYFYVKIIDGFLPYPRLLVYISGVAEVLCGAGLLFPSTCKAAAWGTIALLIAIFPANIRMAIQAPQFHISSIILYMRLPLQLVLIWLAYLYT